MNRRKLGMLAILAGVFAMLAAACGSDPTATPSPTPTQASQATPTPDPVAAEWAALKAAAAQEGELIAFFCCAFGDRIQPFIDEAEDALGIKITSSTGSSNQQWQKVQAERAANVYTLDVWTGGLNTTNRQLVPGGALTDLKSLLFHPEVTDESLWFEGQFWADVDLNKVFAYGGSASGAEISYNTNLVDPSEITSYWDLLDEKWKGKIVARDPRIAGTSQSTALFYLLMGPEFLEQILKEIVIVEDARQAAEQLAQGTYALCLFACTQEVQAAREDGLPVQEEWPGAVEEGARVSTGGNTLVAMDHPKNPNAQKLFVNWFLSGDGQTWWQRITEEQSLRNDIPTDMVKSNSVRDPNKDYLLFERDPNFQQKLDESLEFARQVLASTGQ